MLTSSVPPHAVAAMELIVPDFACQDDPAPHARLLSNGRYTVLISGAGSGVSTCGGYALTSWSRDRTEDGDGLAVYLRDLETGLVWSAARQPVRRRASSYIARYECGREWIERHDDGVEARLEVRGARGRPGDPAAAPPQWLQPTTPH